MGNKGSKAGHRNANVEPADTFESSIVDTKEVTVTNNADDDRNAGLVFCLGCCNMLLLLHGVVVSSACCDDGDNNKRNLLFSLYCR